MGKKKDFSAKAKKDDDYEVDPEEQKITEEEAALKAEKVKRNAEEMEMEAEDEKIYDAAAKAHHSIN